MKKVTFTGKRKPVWILKHNKTVELEEERELRKIKKKKMYIKELRLREREKTISKQKECIEKTYVYGRVKKK